MTLHMAPSRAEATPLALVRGDGLGVHALLQTLRQHRRPALLAFSLVLLATVLYWVTATPVYRADTLVQLSQRPRATLLPTLDDGPRGAEGERRDASGEIEVLRSRDVLMPAIASAGADVVISDARRWGFVPVGSRHGIESVRLGLPETLRGGAFKLAVEGGAWQLRDDTDRVLAKGQGAQETAFTLDGQLAWIRVALRPGAPDTMVSLRQEHPLKAYENVLERLRLFEPGRESGVVRISYEDSDPVRAAALLNAMVTGYLQHAVSRRAEEGRQALEYLDGQLPQLEARVRAAEDALAKYQRSGTGVSVGSEAEALLRQRGDLERQLTELQVKRAQLSQTLTAQHPDLAGVNAQLASVRSALARTGASTTTLPEQQRDLTRLQREVQVATQQYSALLDRAQQLRIAASSWLAGARQLDRASVPVEPVRPKTGALFSIGLGLASILGIATALLMRAMRGTVSDVFEIESALGPATVASIPQSTNQPRLMDGRLDEAVETDMGTHRLLARAAPQDPAIESLRSVHLSLMLRARSIQAQVVLVTSPSYGAGKSFVASNLAALMAESGKRVLLVEADMRRPAIYRYVGLDPNAAGLSDVLCGARQLDEVIYPHASANLDTLMQGTATDNPGSLLLLPALATTLEALRERYDHIVIHTPPLMAVGDTLAFARAADCALLVVRAEQSLLDEANEAARRLERAGIRLEGVIFNGVRPARHGGLAQV